MKRHFHPLGFEATLESPHSLVARISDPTSGEPLLTVTGIRCSISPTLGDVRRIIHTVEADLELITTQLATRKALHMR
jgi:hypothetical protein